MGEIRTANLRCVPGDYGNGYVQPLGGSVYSIGDVINITWHGGGGGGVYGNPKTDSIYIYDLYLMSYIESGDRDGLPVAIADNTSFPNSNPRTVDSCGGIYLSYIYKIPITLDLQIPGMNLTTSQFYISATNRTPSSNAQSWFSPNFLITNVTSSPSSTLSSLVASATPSSISSSFSVSILQTALSSINSPLSTSSSTSIAATDTQRISTPSFSPTSATTPSVQQEVPAVKNSTHLAPGVKIGMGVGAALAIAFSVAVLYFLREMRRRKKSPRTEAEEHEEGTRYRNRGLDGIMVRKNESEKEVGGQKSDSCWEMEVSPAAVELPAGL